MRQDLLSTADDMAQQRDDSLFRLIWHARTFVIVNAFFWLFELVSPDGASWSIWFTVIWAGALAGHGLSYLKRAHRFEQHKTAEYLEQLNRRIIRTDHLPD